MPKSLGQIHTVNYTMPVTASGNKLNIDLPGRLTSQLQRMVRAGTYHKVVGIDLDITTTGTVGGGQITGKFKYYSPTQGRCAAFREAFESMREVMKTQGLNMRDNKMYDFRAPINDDGTVQFFANQATLDGTNGLCLNNVATPGASIFGVYNESQRPQFTQAAGDQYKTGFDTILTEAYTNATGNIKPDFVLNDRVIYTGNEHVASIDYQTIPFSVSYTPDSTDLTLNMQWRPDPALFLAVLCGQLQVEVEEVNFDGGASELELNIAVMVSGWKSIMGSPDGSKKKGGKR